MKSVNEETGNFCGREDEISEKEPHEITRGLPIWLCIALAIIVPAVACQRHVTLSRNESGGLGLNRSEWEQAHGSAVSEDSAYVRYRLHDAEVFLNFSGARGASYIGVDYPTKNGVPVEVARVLARALIPLDSVLRRTYSPAEEGIADAFSSESLTRLDEDWEGEPIGSFTVWYSLQDRLVSGFSIRTGKGPAQ